MGKLEYLELLKRAMLGLPPEVQARTLGYYEQRFVDGVNTGRSEQDVAQELDDPTRIAMTLRASSHQAQLGAQSGAQAGTHTAAQTAPQFGAQPGGQFSVSGKHGPAKALKLLVSGTGLAIFNLFMIVPAMVFSALLFALYAAALAFYLSGIAITASGLAGNSDLLLDLPSRYVQIDADDPDAKRQIRVQIDDTGIHVHEEGAAEAVAANSLHITTDMDADSRTTQTAVGIGMVLGGIALFLFSLVATRFTFVGIKRYIQMNFSLLKGH